jgi:hypothetical protein
MGRFYQFRVVKLAIPAVEPDSIGNDIGRESVSFVGIHEPILAISAH